MYEFNIWISVVTNRQSKQIVNIWTKHRNLHRSYTSQLLKKTILYLKKYDQLVYVLIKKDKIRGTVLRLRVSCRDNRTESRKLGHIIIPEQCKTSDHYYPARIHYTVWVVYLFIFLQIVWIVKAHTRSLLGYYTVIMLSVTGEVSSTQNVILW